MTALSHPSKPAVIDASVALKWQLNDEEYMGQALALRDDFLVRGALLLFAPSLFIYEVTNGLASAVRRGRLARVQGEEALRNFVIADIALRLPPLDRMYQIALDYGLSVYDSSYVSLAEALGAELWTADRQLYEAVQQRLPFVHWVGDYPF